MTTPEYTDRILGTVTSATVANRALWLLTGNNLRLVGDLNRRYMIARIDPAMESSEVYRRRFDLDPADYCRRHRLEMIGAALTILRGYFAAGKPEAAQGRFASFEDWSDTARQAVAWMGAKRFAPVVDPLKILDRQSDNDPERGKLSSLLAAWLEIFRDNHVTAGKVLSVAASEDNNDKKRALHDAVAEIAGGIGDKHARLFARWLERQEGKIISGRCLARAPESTGGLKWWYVRQKKGGQPGGKSPKDELEKLDKLDASNVSRESVSCQFATSRGNLPTFPTFPTPESEGEFF